MELKNDNSVWKPFTLRKENLSSEELKTQQLYRKFQGILNKLTVEKFDILWGQVQTLEIDSQKRLEGIISLIYEQAVNEHLYIVHYAAMCNKLSIIKVPAVDGTSGVNYSTVKFRDLIITKIQHEFQCEETDEQVLHYEMKLEECADPTNIKKIKLTLEEAKLRARMRAVGNVKLIGELYKHGMLTTKIINYCCKYLIDKVEDVKLECLCNLLTCSGKKIEADQFNAINEFYVKEMQEIIACKSNSISKRVRFMLQDVIDLRKRKWIPKYMTDFQLNHDINAMKRNPNRNTPLNDTSRGTQYWRQRNQKITIKVLEGRETLVTGGHKDVNNIQLYTHKLYQKLTQLCEKDRNEVMNSIDNLVDDIIKRGGKTEPNKFR